ncbi:MAG: cyclic nucleotide-binding domain-containing protein [Gemmatimonadetes bacterium]|nr:cyclic nucleotide-binding domain-containing protein [Gemmatimonadota bacterium]
MEIVERADVLRKARILEGVRAEDLAAIAILCREASFEADEVIFEEGDAGRTLFVVVRGRVEARKGGHALFDAAPGQSVGSLSLLDGRPTNYSAVALEPTEALVLGRSEFQRVLQEREAVRNAVIDYLTGVVRGLNEPPEDRGASEGT